MQIHARPEPTTIDTGRTALLVIDMQNAFGAPGGMFDKAGVPTATIQAAVAPTKAAIETARAAGVRVIWVRMGFQSDLGDLGIEDGPNARFLGQLGVKEGALERGTWATDLVEQLEPADGDITVWKTRFSSFYETELDDLLKQSQITHLIVTGRTTSICVESTVRDAFFRDYHCIVLEDCTAEPMGAGLSRSNHEATTLLFERVFGCVSTSNDLRDALTSSSS